MPESSHAEPSHDDNLLSPQGVALIARALKNREVSTRCRDCRGPRSIGTRLAGIPQAGGDYELAAQMICERCGLVQLHSLRALGLRLEEGPDPATTGPEVPTGSVPASVIEAAISQQAPAEERPALDLSRFAPEPGSATGPKEDS